MRSSSKALRFPKLGLAAHLSYGEATIPNENRDYATPGAKNVRGQCTFGDRSRGGSRPGLRAVTGAVTVSRGGRWLWPNGEAVKWPNGDTLTYTTVTQELTAPDGTAIIDPHEPFTVSCAKGAVPSTPSLAAMYRDRLFLAYGASWFCSRLGELGDFDYGGDGEDPARALSGNCAVAGRKGERITAFMPIEDDLMFVATARSLSCFQGEPSSGLRRVSEFTGCISANAWCLTPQGVVFIAMDGVYGATGDGVRLLSGRLPREFDGWKSALLGYDPEAKGVHIFGIKEEKRTANGTTTTVDVAHDWFLDLDAMAFWPVEVPAAMRPTALCRIIDGGIEKAALRGADGTWRMFDIEADTDGGTTLASEVTIGPFRVSSADNLDGLLDEVRVTLGEGSGSVSLGVAVGKTAEAAVKAAREATKQYGGGYNYTQRARRRGAWACLKLTSSARWAYESVLVTLKHLGRLR